MILGLVMKAGETAATFNAYKKSKSGYKIVIDARTINFKNDN